jgi:hypothetical protein
MHAEWGLQRGQQAVQKKAILLMGGVLVAYVLSLVLEVSVLVYPGHILCEAVCYIVIQNFNPALSRDRSFQRLANMIMRYKILSSV